MNRTKFITVCCITACICFGIVSYGHFYRGRTELGVLFAVLAAAQILIAVLVHKKQKQ